MNQEYKDWIIIGGIIIGGFGIVAWYKGGGRFDAVVGVFIALFGLLIAGLVFNFIIMLVRNYFHNRKNK